ncbi:MAG: response regulator transcription factor [Clostridia bacterium]|nr:response regulator transcription factor [Clostridia bacterium]
MKIVICDDLAQERAILRDYIRRLEKEDSLELDITEFDSAEALVAAYDKGLNPDVVFLDVYMPGTIGTVAAKALAERGYTGSVVFCTTSLDHAVESYKLKADGYLVKPYSYEDFLGAIWRCRAHFEKSKKCLSFVSERIDYQIPLSDITYIETANRGCDVHTVKQTLFTYKKIGEIEDVLRGEAAFLKIGRCYIVNMSRIQKTDTDSLFFADGGSVPLPSRDKKRLLQTVNDWFWRVARGDTDNA